MIADPYALWLQLALHMTGENDSTIFSDVSLYKNSISRYGDAKIKTTQSKFGDGSAYFDGSGDYLIAGGENRFSFGSLRFCIDTWLWPQTLGGGDKVIVDFRGGSGWVFFINSANRLQIYDGGLLNQSSIKITSQTWQHIEIDKFDNTTMYFINGVYAGTASSSKSSYSDASSCKIASRNDISNFYNGYMSDFRILKYIARHTDTGGFSVPTDTFDAPDFTQIVPRYVNNRYARNVIDGGDGEFVSPALYPFTMNGVPFRGKLRAFDERSGRLVRQMYSNDDGSWRMSYLNRNQQYLVVGYDGNDYPALAYDHQIPTKMS